MTRSKLIRYLRYEIHGVTEHPRRPRRRTRRGPARNAKYRAWVRTLPCAACGSIHSVEAAHTGSDGGMRQKSSDYSCVPLCTDCHTMAEWAYHRVGREQFEQAFNLNFKALVKRLNHEWFAYSSEVK